MLDAIKNGSKGDLVKVAKYLLGYSEMNKATEEYDDMFEAFVVDWKAEHGLPSDGLIDDATWKKIFETLPTCSTNKNTKTSYVCAIQILIGGLTVDGVYGSGTKKAVAAYQSAAGLTSDGVCGPKTWTSLIFGTTTVKETTGGSGTGAGQTVSGGKVLNKCVHYIQWDSKWKNIKYSTHTSSQTIGNSGCGPSSMAMIMATFIDKNITPVEMCALAVKAGYRTENNGTAWGFYEYVYKKYDGFSKFIDTTSVETLKAGLKEGALAVCSMNSNDNNFWTKGGHFIVAIGYDSDGYIYANDPNKQSAPRKQLQSKFKTCLKHAFLFWPEAKPDAPVNKDDTAKVPTSTTKGDKIIDISKHQGKVNWDLLAPNVSFVFLKASGLYKNGADTQYANNVSGAVSHGVPFHVYHFLYCLTEDEAKRDAKLFYDTVKAQKHMPLSWALDCEADWGISSKKARGIAEAFEAELRRLAGDEIKVGVYIANEKYKEYNLDYDHYDYVWIPFYRSTKPSHPCDLWQYTSTGKVSGISGNVDMNVITGTGHDLAWFLGEKTEQKVKESKPAEITPIESVSGKTVKISGGDCYVRTASGTTGGIIGVAFNGETFSYAGLTSINGWLLINFNGKIGWVSGKYGHLI